MSSKGRLQLLAYVLIVSMAVAGFFIQHTQSSKIERARRETTYQTCLSGNDSRAILSDLLTLAINQPAVDYSKFSAYTDLDPNLKKFLSQVAAYQGTPEASGAIRDYIKERLPQRDCATYLAGATTAG